MLTSGFLVLALAQPQATELPPVRVISNRPTYRPETQVVRPVEKNALEKGDRLPELLKTTPGLNLRHYGTGGAVSSVSLRGSSSEGVLVEVDGIRLNSPLSGLADLNRVPLLGIGNVEILNGAGTGGAAGGTIRLDTVDTLPSLLKVGFGSWGRQDYRAQFGSEDFSLAVGKENAVNDFGYLDRGTPAIRSNSGLDSTSLFFKGKRQLGETPWLSRFMGMVDLRNQGVPGASNFPTPKAKQEDVNLLAAFSIEGKPQPESQAKFSLLQRSDRIHFQDPDAVLSPKYTSLGVDSLELKGEWGLSEPRAGHFPKVVFSMRRDATMGTILKAEDVYGLRLRDEYLGEWGSFEGDLGLNHFSLAGTAFSPRIGWSRAEGDLRGHASFGSTFRAPTFNERFWPEDTFAKGNPDIRPERNTTLDFGIDRKFGDFKLGLTLFASLGQEQIVWQPSGGKWLPLNVSEAIGRGSEFEASYAPAPDLLVTGNYTFCQMTSQGKQLVLRPMDQASLTGIWGPEGKRLACEVSYIGDRFTTPDNTDKLPASLLLGLSGEWKIGQETLYGKVDNLLDASYQSVPYYPMPGRTFFLGVIHPF